ncbi:MAG TPA: hypothetical protein VMU57_08795 [Edaphobacter sp.]|uniref:hypothetical protein n=1 Tax=Edaphobacter sp. TaxID=1934404 RepID=UPI002C120F66|nr:hypothetical protein [Edaphobacter sp.]HUZ94997.1 hypothetical protein [Edaphobacter sp.]
MMTLSISEAVFAAEQNVLTAAGWVVNSYEAAGGYTVPLSFNLRSLADAVRAWRVAMHAASLDSDTNGFIAGEGGYSNEQSAGEAETQRRGCAKASHAETQGERTVRGKAGP